MRTSTSAIATSPTRRPSPPAPCAPYAGSDGDRLDPKTWASLEPRFYYVTGEFGDPKTYAAVDRAVVGTAAAIPWLWDKQPNVASKNVKGVIDLWNATSRGFTILKSVELDILESGKLDLPDDVLAEADYVVATVHYGLNQTEKELTRRLDALRGSL